MATAKIKQTLKSPVGFSAVGLLVQGDDVLASDVAKQVRQARRQKDGQYAWIAGTPLTKPKEGVAYPTGLCLLPPAGLWVASNRGNSVQLVNRTTDEVEQVVPVASPPMPSAVPAAALLRQQLGRRPAGKDDPQVPCPAPQFAWTPGPRWPITVPCRSGAGVRQVAAAQDHPRRPASQRANRQQGRNLRLRRLRQQRHGCGHRHGHGGSGRDHRLPARDPAAVGSGSNALALAPDGGTLYVANGTNNCIAVIRLGRPRTPARIGRRRATWPD